jgi:2-keto-3-deoxy-L-rhamnonate aldolase RhmA
MSPKRDERTGALPAAAFKRKLAAGEPVLVVNPDHPHPSLVDFFARLPIDAVFIDCEQGSAGIETVEHLARAARLAEVTSLVRLFAPDDWVIERYLGRGVDGIVVPRLERAAQARRVVDAVRYCHPRDAATKVVVVQIETREALDDLPGFLAVEGIDAYFLGPVDLAKSMGHAGDYRNPAMQARLADAIGAIRAAGKVAGMLVTAADVQHYVGCGARFLYTHVNDFLLAGARPFAAAAGARGAS